MYLWNCSMNFKIEVISLDEHYKLANDLYQDRNTTSAMQPPYGLCQYVGLEVVDRVLTIAIAVITDDGKKVGTVMSRNISDTKIYASSIWIEPAYRGYGLASMMRRWLRDFWPPQYDQILGYFLSSTFITRAISKTATAVEYPEHCWFPVNSKSNPHEKTILGYTEFK